MNSKICKICGQEKDISEFGKNGKYIRNQCKKCYSIKQKESHRKYYKKKSAESGYRKKENKRLRDWRKKNPFWDLGKLSKKFGYTKEQFSFLYNKLYSEQQGQCAICNIKLIKHDKNTYVDHNKMNNQVRGLLCPKCNFAIGLLNDSASNCLRANDYLTNYLERFR